MKKKILLCGLVLILGLLVFGCGGDDGSIIPGPPTVNPYFGTVWEGTELVGGTSFPIFYTFTNTNWLKTRSDGVMQKGTYTYSGNELALIRTHWSGGSYGNTWTEDQVIEENRTFVADVTNNTTMRFSGLDPLTKQEVTPISYTDTIWTGDKVGGGRSIKLTFASDNSCEISFPDAPYIREGTYTPSGAAISFTITRYSNDSGDTWDSIPSDWDEAHSEALLIDGKMYFEDHQSEYELTKQS